MLLNIEECFFIRSKDPDRIKWVSPAGGRGDFELSGFLLFLTPLDAFFTLSNSPDMKFHGPITQNKEIHISLMIEVNLQLFFTQRRKDAKKTRF